MISIKRLRRYLLSFLFVIPFVLSELALSSGVDNYLVGAGKWDITGTAAEIGMMGYADIKQKSSGIHTRQFSRAFIVAEPYGKRVVFVSVDAGMVFQSVKQKVTEKLNLLYPGIYTDDNVILSATHTHSTVGGQSHYTLYNFTIGGFIKQNFNVMVDGIVKAIGEAHDSLAPGRIYYNKGELTNASINRSLTAYENNPVAERDLYNSSIDPDMYVLRFMQADQPIGAITWFSVHPVSMGMTNTLLSSDHKGYAQSLLEQKMKQEGHDNFIAAYAQGNNGDMTSNLWLNSRGPTDNEFENTRIIGERQFDKSWELYSTSSTQIEGPIDFRFTYRDYSKQVVDGRFFADGQKRNTCTAALGYSFAAGSTEDASPVDGPWHEGQLDSNAISRILSTLIFFPTKADRECQLPKPVLLATGRGIPVPWTPEVLPVSILRLGQIAILAVPGEFTVMSGRRIRKTVLDIFDGELDQAIIAGLSNAYSGYVTTPEEYALQHYEGGSTHFGPWTLPAYQQTFFDLASDMKNETVEPSPIQPRDLSGFQANFTIGVVHDQTPIGKSFGQVVKPKEVKAVYSPGQQLQVRFWTGHPRNDLRTMGSYLEVQRQTGSGWATVATDNDWETKYNWKRIDGFWGTSQAIIQWQIPEGTPQGRYRIVHKGEKKTIFTGRIKSFTGYSPEFLVQ